MRKLGLLCVALVTGACDSIFGYDCTTEARPALLVHVSDSVSGAPVQGRPLIVARSAAFADTAWVWRANWHTPEEENRYHGPYPLAFERSGTYTVDVQAPGYAPWTRGGFRTTSDRCHVRTVNVEARLVPLPAASS